MNYYWWRSNGPSGQSGHIYAESISDAEIKVLAQEKEPDIYVVLLKKNVKRKHIEKHSQQKHTLY